MNEKFIDFWTSIRFLYVNTHLPCSRYELTQRPIVSYDDYLPLVNKENQFKIENNHLYLPVVRYEKYDYADPRQTLSGQNRYHGHFFYFEPQSHIILDLGQTMFFPSKNTCARWLQQYYDPNNSLDSLSQSYIGGSYENTIQQLIDDYIKNPSIHNKKDHDYAESLTIRPQFTDMMTNWNKTHNEPWWNSLYTSQKSVAQTDYYSPDMTT